VCPDGWWLLESAWVAVRLAGLAIVAALAGVGEYLEELVGPLPELPEYTPPRRGRRPKEAAPE